MEPLEKFINIINNDPIQFSTIQIVMTLNAVYIKREGRKGPSSNETISCTSEVEKCVFSTASLCPQTQALPLPPRAVPWI